MIARALVKRSVTAIAGLTALLCGMLVLTLLGMWVVNRFPTELPRPTGAFSVGRMILTWVDADHHDRLRRTPEADRELAAWIWYPSRTRSPGTAVYLPSRWRAALARSGGILMTNFLTRDLARVRAHSTEDAPLAPDERQYPVVLLLPGAGALAAGYTALAEDLASHGYIVVGLNAAYLTTAVVLSHGKVAYRAPQYDLDDVSDSQAAALAAHLIELWCANIRFAIDRLEALNASNSGSLFAGRLDLQRLGLMGHSLGGAITANFCYQDPRCKAGIDLDGRLFGPVIANGLSQPFMMVFEEIGSGAGAEATRVLAQAHSMYGRLPAASRIGISIAGANHFTFSDQMLVKNPIPLFILRHVGVIGLSGTQGLRITEDYVSAFFGVYLEGHPRGDLDDLRREYREVHVW